jgi:hypothetical protein
LQACHATLPGTRTRCRCYERSKSFFALLFHSLPI